MSPSHEEKLATENDKKANPRSLDPTDSFFGDSTVSPKLGVRKKNAGGFWKIPMTIHMDDDTLVTPCYPCLFGNHDGLLVWTQLNHRQALDGALMQRRLQVWVLRAELLKRRAQV